MTQPLKLIGFYDEFAETAGDNLFWFDRREPAHQPSGKLVDAICAEGERDEAEIIRYLDAGLTILPLMEHAPDCLDKSDHARALGGSSHVTDGAWLWRRDLPHYVAKYHVRLPHDFLEMARSAEYRPPRVDIEHFRQRYRATLPILGWPGDLADSVHVDDG